MPSLWILMFHHPPPQPEPLLVELGMIWRNVTKPNVASQQYFFIPVLVERYQIADVSVTHIRLLRQHPRHKHVINTKYSLVTVLVHLDMMLVNMNDENAMIIYRGW